MTAAVILLLEKVSPGTYSCIVFDMPNYISGEVAISSQADVFLELRARDFPCSEIAGSRYFANFVAAHQVFAAHTNARNIVQTCNKN
ncbi:hypothetical protein [Ensifer sp. LBL]|uniref:hypothetical protein n=1 Tax=Ensifer sp. LBL TaxID=2991056 RepID=UPI003D25E435